MGSKKTLNVLQFICPTGFYGAERWILALAKNLPSDSVRCDLAITLEDNSRNLGLVEMFRQRHGEAFELAMAHRFDISVIGKLVDLIRKRNIDVIHTHGYKSDILGILAARIAGIKCVVTPHGFENSGDLKLRFFIWLGCKSMFFADAVAPLSRQLVEDVGKAGVPDGKISYIQNGVDISEVDLQKSRINTFKSDSEKRIGFIGQMIGRKNITDILDIFDALASEHESVRLILVGDGDQRAALERYSRQLRNYRKIDFLGFRPDRLELLQSFDLFVMTSTMEGIPRCLMEACAMGIPVAAYKIPGIDQLIKHGETGLLAAPGDKDQLKSYWEKLLYDQCEARRLSENARSFIDKNYSSQRMADQYHVLFNQLLGR